MASSLKRFLKLTCTAVSLSWLGSQGLLLYHLKYGAENNPLTHISDDAIPLSIQNSRQNIVQAVLGLYRLDYKMESVMHYDENAVFEDPAVYLKGRKSVNSAFAKMGIAFRKSESLKVNVLHGEHLVTIDILQRYTLPGPGSLSFELPSIIYLYLQGEPGEEKIIHHVEEWRSKHLLGKKDASYFANVGFVAAQFRKLHGLPFKYI